MKKRNRRTQSKCQGGNVVKNEVMSEAKQNLLLTNIWRMKVSAKGGQEFL